MIWCLGLTIFGISHLGFCWTTEVCVVFHPTDWKKLRKSTEMCNLQEIAVVKSQVSPVISVHLHGIWCPIPNNISHSNWSLKEVVPILPWIHGFYRDLPRTLLSLLGHMIFPQDGQIFIPSHLRILHVTQDWGQGWKQMAITNGMTSWWFGAFFPSWN